LRVGDGFQRRCEGVLTGWGQCLAGVPVERHGSEVLYWAIDGAAEAELGHFWHMDQT
jgi:hypothetical protein